MNFQYEVKANVDYTGNHITNPIDIIEEETFEFNDLLSALDFLNECTYPITLLSDLMEEHKEYKVIS